MTRSLSLIAFSLLFIPTFSQAAVLELQQRDHICLVGNALGERMQHQNAWETLLYKEFPAEGACGSQSVFSR